MSIFRVPETMKNYLLVYFSLVSPGMNIFLLINPPSRISKLTMASMSPSSVTYPSGSGFLLCIFIISLNVGTILVIIATRFLWFRIAFANPPKSVFLTFSLIFSFRKIVLQMIKNFGSRRMWQILVSLTNFRFLAFVSSDSLSSSLGEVRRKLTGTRKGSRSLKQ